MRRLLPLVKMILGLELALRVPQDPPDPLVPMALPAPQAYQETETQVNRLTKLLLSTAIRVVKSNGWYRLSGRTARLARTALRALRVRQGRQAGLDLTVPLAPRDLPALLVLRELKAQRPPSRVLLAQQAQQAQALQDLLDLQAAPGRQGQQDPPEQA